MVLFYILYTLNVRYIADYSRVRRSSYNIYVMFYGILLTNFTKWAYHLAKLVVINLQFSLFIPFIVIPQVSHADNDDAEYAYDDIKHCWSNCTLLFYEVVDIKQS